MTSAANLLQLLNGNNHLPTNNNMKRLISILFVLITLHSFAQVTDSSRTWHVGIFASLYLDSSFDGSNYKFDKQMPKHILSGLDFVEGSLMAFDSLGKQVKLSVKVFDLRSASQSISKLKTQNSFDSLDMMIGAVVGAEYRQLADLAFQKNIPFISATFPNDGGVTNNPYTIITNSTLPVHCQAIYNYVLRNFATANIIYLRKKGQQEDRLASYFESSNKGAAGSSLLKWKTITTDSVAPGAFQSSLDSEKVNIIIAGSLDERFATQLINSSKPFIKKYSLQLMGMPTWETLKDITKSEWKDIPICYSTTFYNSGFGKWAYFTKTFTDKTNGRPSDLAFKGFDLTYVFTQLLFKYGTELNKNLTDKSFKWFLDYDFRPVLNKTSGKPDYYENKRIFILKRTNGLISKMN
ncbi:MAG: hypothetical protein K2X48_19960 [Chitinophagaceae bacterium]|nr:hypothetical protein [Chitinophagaceae bacterium]